MPYARFARFRISALAASLSLAAALLGLAALGACKGSDARAERVASDSASPRGSESDLALPVVGEPVRRGDLVLTVTTTGQVQSDAVAQLKAETSGSVDEVLVQPGDRVRKGRPLIRLDPRPFDLAVREAEANLEEANIRLHGNLTADSILLGGLGSAERSKNAAALSGVPASEVRLDQAKLDRERATITAPFDGIVDRVSVAAGERVGPGQDVAKVVDASHLRVEAQVLEHDLPLIRIGGEALIATAAAPDRPVRGSIVAILPLVDTTTRAGRVIVRVETGGAGRGDPTGRPYPATQLQPGMYADVRLEAARLSNRVIVPSRAVIERDGRPLVFVVKEHRAQWVYITPGRTNGADTEVLADSTSGQIPVAVGDTVLVEGHLTLTHDAPVRLVVAAERTP
jgi:RND family efflux transporter MFP subunit